MEIDLLTNDCSLQTTQSRARLRAVRARAAGLAEETLGTDFSLQPAMSGDLGLFCRRQALYSEFSARNQDIALDFYRVTQRGLQNMTHSEAKCALVNGTDFFPKPRKLFNQSPVGSRHSNCGRSPLVWRQLMTRPRILLADDHPVVLDGLRSVLGRHYEIVGSVLNGRDLVEAAQRLKPDLIVVRCHDAAVERHRFREADSKESTRSETAIQYDACEFCIPARRVSSGRDGIRAENRRQ